MKYIFRKGSSPKLPTLLLLHGTGGTEYDLLPIAQRIAPDSNALSIRGKVQENGMARFFRRLAEGLFDEEDLLFRTEELNGWIDPNKLQPVSRLAGDSYSKLGERFSIKRPQ